MKLSPGLAGALVWCLAAVAPVSAVERPNVIFILADDLGWADTTLFGHTNYYETPNLERLAKRGMVFGRSYSAPLCSPTRAAILTGQNNTRNGSTAPTHHIAGEAVLSPSVAKAGPPGNKVLGITTVNRLDSSLPTLGKLFKEAGYATGHFGKWHLGPEPYSPLEHGFDVDVPHFNGPGPAGSFVAPWKYPQLQPKRRGEHIEDRMAAEAVAWMKGLPEGQPFFMNYWMFSVHAPFDAKEASIEKFRGMLDRERAQRSPTYAAMVEAMDDAVGTLLDAVDAAGLTENTVFIFTSDNGGNMYNGIRERDAEGEEFIAAPTSNAPLRGGKATIYEGGIRVPTVVVWPGITGAGSRSDELVHCTDFYATLAGALSLEVPEEHVVDGMDIRPAMRGGVLEREAIFTFFPHNPMVPDWLPPSICVHSGVWKLIRLFHQGEDGAHDYRLYRLSDDVGETRDLAGEHPDVVRRLDGLIEAHLVETKAVVPLRNSAFDEAKYRPELVGIQPGGLKVEGGRKAAR